MGPIRDSEPEAGGLGLTRISEESKGVTHTGQGPVSGKGHFILFFSCGLRVKRAEAEGLRRNERREQPAMRGQFFDALYPISHPSPHSPHVSDLD